MKIQYLIIIAFSLLALTACFDKAPVAKSPHTVTWFMKHDEALQQTLKVCSDDPAKYQKQPTVLMPSMLQIKNQRVNCIR